MIEQENMNIFVAKYNILLKIKIKISQHFSLINLLFLLDFYKLIIKMINNIVKIINFKFKLV